MSLLMKMVAPTAITSVLVAGLAFSAARRRRNASMPPRSPLPRAPRRP